MNAELPKDESSLRRIVLSGGLTVEQNFYPLNTVRSTNYTWWSLLPQNLFEQMQRTSNIWFLLVSVFQLIPSNLNPADSWSTIVPLGILLAFTLMKDAYNDHERLQDDKKINESRYLVWSGEQFKSVPNSQLQVGNLVLLHEGELIPSDLLLLLTGGGRSSCYVNESSVNGSVDLAKKSPVEET